MGELVRFSQGGLLVWGLLNNLKLEILKMNKGKLALSALTTLLLASGANAAPVTLSLTQMDTVSGGAFVCPVISTAAVLNSPKSAFVDGQLYTIIGPTVGGGVQAHATNDNGAGNPHGPYASPGDTSYTAIWN